MFLILAIILYFPWKGKNKRQKPGDFRRLGKLSIKQLESN